MKDIKTIIFDLGGVVFTSGTSICVKKVIDAYNIKSLKAKKKVKNFFSDTPNSEGNLIRLGLISMEQFEDRFYSSMNLKENNKNHVRNIWFYNYCVQYNMEELIKELKKKDYRLVLFSGNIKERIEFLYQKYAFLNCFDEAIFSFDYKKNKEDIEFYRELINHIQCEPSQAIMIDDELKNINMAKSLGFQTIYYCYPDQLIDDLKRFGIKISI